MRMSTRHRSYSSQCPVNAFESRVVFFFPPSSAWFHASWHPEPLEVFGHAPPQWHLGVLRTMLQEVLASTRSSSNQRGTPSYKTLWWRPFHHCGKRRTSPTGSFEVGIDGDKLDLGFTRRIPQYVGKVAIVRRLPGNHFVGQFRQRFRHILTSTFLLNS